MFITFWVLHEQDRKEREQQWKLAAETEAYERAFNERNTERKEKPDKKMKEETGEHITQPKVKSPGLQEDISEIQVVPAVPKRKMKKKKSKKPARPDHEEQQVAADIPDNIKEEETEATTPQAPMLEQQLCAVSALEKEAQDVSTTATTRTTFFLKIKNWVFGKKKLTTDIGIEGSTSTDCLPQQENRDGSDEDEQSDEEKEEENPDDEEVVPDEAFMLEGASSTLVCPVSFTLMTSAVIAMDTHFCQKEALEEWVEHCKAKGVPLTSPLTNAPMEPQMIINQAFRILVRERIEAREQAWIEQLAERKKRGRPGGR